ncbi:MAG TPA: hypothetical protein VFP13_07455 [Actinomycetota bacterium]|nr:hypothetical protein [Actinomycetota bacterium]
MGRIRDFLRFRKQAKDAGELMPAADLAEALGAASGTLEDVPGILDAIVDAEEEAERLRRDGVEATATLVAVRDTGITIGTGAQDGPMAELDLDVVVGDGPPERVTTRQVVPRLSGGRLVPGSELPVIVDPTDHTKLVVDWDASP